MHWMAPKGGTRSSTAPPGEAVSISWSKYLTEVALSPAAIAATPAVLEICLFAMRQLST
jgi:hypothetical protein